jgi:hypothetical protein
MSVTVGDALRVVNKGSEPVVFQWDGRKYRCDTEALIPFEAVVNMLGDPRAGSTAASVKDQYGTQHMIPARSDEVTRLWSKHSPPDGGLVAEGILTRAPNCEVYDPETNDRIYTVVDDPTGNTQMAVTQDSITVEDQLKKMENQVALLKRQVNAQQVAEPPTLSPDDIPTDDEEFLKKR